MIIKNIFIKLIVFISVLFLVDHAVGFLLSKLYFKQNHGYYYRSTYALEGATSELLILGSSKATHHYIPKKIMDSLPLSCYNAGKDGSFILYNDAVLRSATKRYTPKIVILDLLDDEFEQRAYKTYDRLSALLPYYKTHPEVRPIAELKSPYEKYKMISAIYPFNSMLLPSLTGTVDFNNKKVSDTNLGYLPLSKVWKGKMAIMNSDNQPLDSNKINAFKDIVSIAKNKNFTLIIVVSPTYKKYVGNNPTLILAKQWADSAGIPFWNYLEDTSFLNNRDYFTDIRHMNKSGAEIFNNLLISRIKAEKLLPQ